MAIRERKKEIPTFCIEFGKHLRKLRTENNLSIEEIAFKAEIDAQNLRKYELGKQEMKISMVKRLADAFNVTPSQLIDFS
mgnify:CR=1 FL=1|tara:strand:+ start:49075 stop:49314 length:240 start_codon:yes stop_codon:yes gene_type:complete